MPDNRSLLVQIIVICLVLLLRLLSFLPPFSYLHLQYYSLQQLNIQWSTSWKYFGIVILSFFFDLLAINTVVGSTLLSLALVAIVIAGVEKFLPIMRTYPYILSRSIWSTLSVTIYGLINGWALWQLITTILVTVSIQTLLLVIIDRQLTPVTNEGEITVN